MRTVVFAYHNMGLAGLEALVRAGYEIAAIFSHEDDPAENCWFGSVRQWAMERGIPLACPEKIDEGWRKKISDLKPEMIFSCYYRHMISEEILAIPKEGAYNLHGSLLPAYRGRCPVNWVLVNGETRTGVTLHHMVKKADAGDIVGQRVVIIDQKDTALTLYGKLCEAAGLLLDDLLPLMKKGLAPRIPQDISRGSYFGGRRPEDGRIDWRWPAEKIYNLIRAVTDPYPGAFCTLADGTKLLIWRAEPGDGDGAPDKAPGTVEIEGDRVWVRAGQGSIRLLEVEAGGKRITAERIAPYFAEKEGTILS